MLHLFSLLAATAFAGDLYVNGQKINPMQLANVKLEKVDVAFGPTGDVIIDAPGYAIQFEEQPTPVVAPPSAATATPPIPSVDRSAPRAVPYAPSPTETAPRVPSDLGRVAAARWWLVTEDNGSSGHTVDVVVNGHTAQTILSGEEQRIIDLRAFLRTGANSVRVQSTSVNAEGGALYVYLGSGSNLSGSLSLDEPQVQFGLGPTRSGSQVRDYTLMVD